MTCFSIVDWRRPSSFSCEPAKNHTSASETRVRPNVVAQGERTAGSCHERQASAYGAPSLAEMTPMRERNSRTGPSGSLGRRTWHAAVAPSGHDPLRLGIPTYTRYRTPRPGGRLDLPQRPAGNASKATATFGPSLYRRSQRLKPIFDWDPQPAPRRQGAASPNDRPLTGLFVGGTSRYRRPVRAVLVHMCNATRRNRLPGSLPLSGLGR